MTFVIVFYQHFLYCFISNSFFQDGGKQLQEGMEENSTIIELDLRLTEVGQESEYCINQILKKNKEQHRELMLQKQDKLLLDR